ncbi:solute carrier family 13 member 2 isoform X4 [Homo sapiens]|uniref:solute carrier family 13 member 2 isoform X4 n=1 Tax=Homo sapiens TaxID=9606 RepID=UPI0005D00864|nr:solute carrier family 13 member 2 isoform X4 [Homo sapiens]XP_054173684.1 solute carrier family 13 member 2 isoform X4 [Homo sapiens]|eukprot:XP_011523755.1 solute carrier family 13 member 2 isoform X4 [Homo sapiens]
MATCWQALWAYRSYLIVFFVPILLLPLPILVPSKEAYCAYAIILMALFWCTEALPLAVTALFPLILFPMMGIVDASEIIQRPFPSSFESPGECQSVGMSVTASHNLGGTVGDSRVFPPLSHVSTCQVAVEYLKDSNLLFFGGLLVAIAVEHWNLHKRIALRVLLIVGVRPAPLILGFMLVTAFLSMWISNTATSAMMVPIAHAVLDQLHSSQASSNVEEGSNNPTFELQEPSPQKEVTKLDNGQALPVTSASSEGRAHLSQKHLHLTQCMSLCVCYSASIGGIATLTGTAPNLVLQGQINSLFPQNGNVVNFASWFSFAFPTMVILLLLAWLWLQILFLGFNMVSDGTVAIFIGIIMFIIPSKFPGLTQDPVENPGKLKAPLGLLDWKTVNQKMPWNIVLLLGGGYALAKGSERSGLSEWLGNKLTPLQSVPAPAIAIILSLLVATFTECTSNVATTTIFLPILASMAQAICLHPLYVMLPCTLATSLAFMLPVATPPNAIVFSFGDLKVLDMARAGFLLNIIGVLIIALAINSWGIPLFSLHSFPSWAQSNTTAQCLPSLANTTTPSP